MKNETIRIAMTRHISASVGSLKGNVWEPTTNTSVVLPQATIRQNAEVDQSGTPYAGASYIYDVWVSVSPETYNSLDILINEVKDSLMDNILMIKDVPHYIQYTGSSTEDMYLEDWDAYSRSITLQVHALDWVLEKVSDPSPVQALIEYSRDNFRDAQLDPYIWDPKETAPALYWRQGDVEVDQKESWGAWYTATIHGHIISPSSAETKMMSDLVVRQMGLDRRTYMSDQSPISFEDIKSDIGYDPFSQGQITVTVRFGLLQDRPAKREINVYIRDRDKITSHIKGGD